MREGGTTGRAKAEQSRDRGNFIVEGRGGERRGGTRAEEQKLKQYKEGMNRPHRQNEQRAVTLHARGHGKMLNEREEKAEKHRG